MGDKMTRVAACWRPKKEGSKVVLNVSIDCEALPSTGKVKAGIFKVSDEMKKKRGDGCPDYEILLFSDQEKPKEQPKPVEKDPFADDDTVPF